MATKKPIRTLKRIEFYRTKRQHDIDNIKDMLRYDVAFMCDKFPGVVAFPTFDTRGSGRHRANPTIGRWESYGVTLSRVEGEPLAIDTRHQEWFTYRHPRSPEGAEIYGQWERVTIQTFFGETRS